MLRAATSHKCGNKYSTFSTRRSNLKHISIFLVTLIKCNLFNKFSICMCMTFLSMAEIEPVCLSTPPKYLLAVKFHISLEQVVQTAILNKSVACQLTAYSSHSHFLYEMIIVGLIFDHIPSKLVTVAPVVGLFFLFNAT